MNSIRIKDAEDLAKMRHAGQLLAQVFAMLDDFVREGVTTMEINQRVDSFITNDLQARPASKPLSATSVQAPPIAAIRVPRA